MVVPLHGNDDNPPGSSYLQLVLKIHCKNVLPLALCFDPCYVQGSVSGTILYVPYNLLYFSLKTIETVSSEQVDRIPGERMPMARVQQRTEVC